MTTRKRPPPEPALESFALARDGTRLYVRQHPSGIGGVNTPTAVLCDGLVCDGYIYRYLWDDLAELLPVAHFHYRGHGRSGLPVDRDRVDVAAHASDMNAVREHLGDPPVVLVGHSLGTQVCLEAYRARPERVRALVLLCGSFGRITHTFKGSDVLSTVLPDVQDFAARHPRLLRALWARVPVRVALKLGVMTGDIDPNKVRVEDVEPYFRHALHVDFNLFVRMLREAGEHSAEDLLPHISVPTLVVAGSKDTFTPPEVSVAMAESIPGARLVLVPGGSHILPLEERGQLLEVLRAFLGSL
ncbi:MAG TPA: alpha/beta hydrolase [Polyangiaceae bacterium]|nr:alpha/beta hydrolase [Polyangiaceae bacterium]